MIFLEYTGEGNTEKTLFLVGKVLVLVYIALVEDDWILQLGQTIDDSFSS